MNRVCAEKLMRVRFGVIVCCITWAVCSHVPVLSGEAGLSVAGPCEAPAAKKYIALTFDDGPHAEYTRQLLVILAHYGANATFFVVGKQVAKFPVLTKEIHAAGHQIANHTYNHPNLTNCTNDEVLRELEWTRFLVQKLTGQGCRFYRPPGGRYSVDIVARAHREGYRMILWSIFPQDHLLQDSATVTDKVVAHAFDGGVVLLHSGMPGTLAALPSILEQLSQQGYRFVTISELINRDVNSPNLYSFYRSGRTFTN